VVDQLVEDTRLRPPASVVLCLGPCFFPPVALQYAGGIDSRDGTFRRRSLRAAEKDSEYLGLTGILFSSEAHFRRVENCTTTSFYHWRPIFVVFESSAGNLDANDTNSVADIFVKNLASGGVVRA